METDLRQHFRHTSLPFLGRNIHFLMWNGNNGRLRPESALVVKKAFNR